jgi:hypothetical protein
MKDFKLDNVPKINSGFKTPEGYFDSLSQNILSQIPKEDTKVIPIVNQQKSWIFAAAAILILALSLPLLNKITNYTSIEIDQQSIEDYITYQSNISEVDLAELLNKKDIEKIKIDYEIHDEALEEVLSSNSNLEYLITN